MDGIDGETNNGQDDKKHNDDNGDSDISLNHDGRRLYETVSPAQIVSADSAEGR